MLTAVDSGRLHEFCGKNLNSIAVDGKQASCCLFCDFFTLTLK